MVTKRRKHSSAMYSEHVSGPNNTTLIYYIYCLYISLILDVSLIRSSYLIIDLINTTR